jgi:sugar fermentation stimulation protein A
LRLPAPLYPGTLLRRYKRFLTDVLLDDGREVVAHLADPGRLPTLALPGRRLWLSAHDRPGRRLAFAIELAEEDGTLVGLNTLNPNRIVSAALLAGRLPAFVPYTTIRREPRLAGGGRLDFHLAAADGRELYLEVKGVTWRRDGEAAFPDAPTVRGARHAVSLAALARTGVGAALLFVAQRGRRGVTSRRRCRPGLCGRRSRRSGSRRRGRGLALHYQP